MSAGSPGEDDDRDADDSVDRDDDVDGRRASGRAEERAGDDEDGRASDREADDGAGDGASAAREAEVARLRERVDALRRELESFETDVEERTLHRSAVESDLRDYVRSQIRRGHARGWGPYLVLLYGTAMTIGAFYLLTGGWAILAMVVIWLSTLGLYALMLIVGAALGVASLPRKAAGRIRDR